MPFSDLVAPARRFLDLPRGERRLTIDAWWQLFLVAALLRWRARETLAAALSEAPSETAPLPAREPAPAPECQPIVRALGRAAAHHLWPMTCLPRALALRRMLARRGIPATLRIGVRRAGASLAAHAWIEVGGAAIGEPEAIEERFRPLLPADGGGATPGAD